MTKRIPPFYENFDNLHCAQCVLRGILEYFEPEEVWDWDTWDQFTGKEPGKWTWPFKGQVNMAERGYTVRAISDADLQKYLDVGIYECLVERLGKEAADKQKEMADLAKVREELEQLLSHSLVKKEQRIPTLKDIQDMLDEGFLIYASLNAAVLDGKEGYASHVVLVYDMDDKFVYIHDSGMPSSEAQQLPIDLYVKASTTPTESKWSIIGYKKEI